MRLANKIGIVTAGASGIGRAGVERFAREGAQVVAVDINLAALEELQAGLAEKGTPIQTMAGNLRDDAFAREIVARTARDFGGLDFVWNHIGHPGSTAFEGVDMAVYDLIMDLTLRSVIVTSEAAISHLRARGGGSLLFTSSTSGLRASARAPLYSVAKFGVTALAKVLARRYGPDKIRVNALCPGPIANTGSLRGFMASLDGARTEDEARAMVDKMAAEIPLGRLGQPEEVAAAAVFLLSDEAAFISGAALPVDGAMTA